MEQELRTGCSYFGRLVTQVQRYTDRLGYVWFEADGEQYCADFTDFNLWLQQHRGEATSPREPRKLRQTTHRWRRGKRVAIPEEWRGRTVHPQTIRKRKSKGNQGRRFRRKVMR